ncbi:MAG: hypothetical protein ABJA74_11115 [Lapillicoccus sp.]
MRVTSLWGALPGAETTVVEAADVGEDEQARPEGCRAPGRVLGG